MSSGVWAALAWDDENMRLIVRNTRNAIINGLKEDDDICIITTCHYETFSAFMQMVADAESRGYRANVKTDEAEYSTGSNWLRLTHETVAVP